MATVRNAVRALLSMGVPSPGWYAVLTGCALLFVAYSLGSVSADDPAAPYAAVVLALAGLWQLERGVRVELTRLRRPTNDAS